MKKKNINYFLGEIFKKLAPQIGARVLIEPHWGLVGQIIFKNGKKKYFRYSSIDLNSLGSSEVAKDKDYANFFMKKMGYPTIAGQAFFSPRWSKAIGSRQGSAAAYLYAKKIGFPLIVKPNSGSQGLGVAKVFNQKEFYQALRFIFTRDNIALVQKFIRGQDYRFVVLDKKVISVYERIPLNIIGDGHSDISRLVKNKLTLLVSLGRPANIKADNIRIINNLKRQKLGPHFIPPVGQKIFLLDNANLSSGGDSLDVTEIVHPEFKKIAIKLTRDMGLRLCGVDLMIAGDIRSLPKKYWVVEINSAPGLDHYVKTGRTQEKIVDKLYLKVLKAMEKA